MSQAQVETEKKSEPAEPSAVFAAAPKVGSGRSVLVALTALVVVLMLGAGTLAGVGFFVGQSLADELQQASAELRQARDEQEQQAIELLEAIKVLPEEIQPAVPPTNDKIFSILGKGMGVTENVVRTGQVGTTPISAFATDLTTTPYNQRTDAWTQEIIIRNRDDATAPTQNLCFVPIPWASVGADCTTKCANAVATITCPAVGGAGASTNGSLVPAGTASHRRYDGTSCICLVASAANTEYQTERVVR